MNFHETLVQKATCFDSIYLRYALIFIYNNSKNANSPGARVSLYGGLDMTLPENHSFAPVTFIVAFGVIVTSVV